MTATDWRVRVVREHAAVARLIASDAGAFARSPFQGADWMRVWAGRFGGAARQTCAVVVEEAATGAVAMVLPLALDRRNGSARLTAWDAGVADYNAPLVAADFAPSRAEMRRLWPRIVAALPRADVLAIEKMPAIVGGRANPLLDLDGVVASGFMRHWLALDPDFERAVAPRFNQSQRRSLARKRKKLENKGTLDFAFVEGEEAAATLERLLGWRRERFAESGRGDLGPIDAFYRSLSNVPGIVRVGRLTLDGRIIAGCFGTLTGDTFQLLVVAHDAAFKNWSPGLLAIELSIERLCGEGVAVYDFTIGGEPYKLDFGVTVEPLYELRVPLSLKGAVVLGARAVAARLKLVAERIGRRARRRRAEPAPRAGDAVGLVLGHASPE